MRCWMQGVTGGAAQLGAIQYRRSLKTVRPHCKLISQAYPTITAKIVVDWDRQFFLSKNT